MDQILYSSDWEEKKKQPVAKNNWKVCVCIYTVSCIQWQKLKQFQTTLLWGQLSRYKQGQLQVFP